MARNIKGSNIEWVGTIPSSWRIMRNRYLFSCSKEIVGDKWSETQLLSLTTSGIRKRSIDDVSGKVPESYDGYQTVNPNQMVMCLFDLDCSAVFSGISPYYGMISPAYRVLSYRSDILPKYADWWFTFVFDGRKYNIYSKNIRFSLSYDDFKDLLTVVPPISEQQAIASYLDAKCSAIDEAIERHKKIIKKLEEYRKSTITATVYAGLNGASLKESGEWCGAIPEEWTLPRIKYLLKERNVRSEAGTEGPLSMSQKVGLVPTRELGDIPHGASSFIGAKIVYPDDLVFNKLKAHLGVFSVSKYTGLVSKDYAVYYSIQKADVKYLEYVFKTPQCIGEFIKRATGVGQGLTRLYTNQLFDIKCPCPSKEEQHQIATYLDEICFKVYEAKLRQQALIERLEEYRKSIIYNAVTGKIDCREAVK